ncbi:unnamed protein product [Darwinula stevensoni]|uniref:Uncharacterized protein n=1 Tax=Darwinula stevensoni TaxID=69355 RepID=A0A7R8X6Z5_9CRUS|nr:unnamed protein product [Darwinula stevensoni]CAG0887372.1 unnamed protein product [Darwinula stevensoni]
MPCGSVLLAAVAAYPSEKEDEGIPLVVEAAEANSLYDEEGKAIVKRGGGGGGGCGGGGGYGGGYGGGCGGGGGKGKGGGYGYGPDIHHYHVKAMPFVVYKHEFPRSGRRSKSSGSSPYLAGTRCKTLYSGLFLAEALGAVFPHALRFHCSVEGSSSSKGGRF